MTARPRRRDILWVAVGLAALAALLAATQATWRLDRGVYDRALSWWQRPPPPLITLIAIDDASLAAIGRWPWRRAVHATLLQQLAAAQPKAVALDLVLSEPDPDPRQDALLAAALQRAAPVVLPVPWVAVSGQGPRWLEPAPLLASAATLAAAEAAVDEDGVLRSAFLHLGPAGAQRPHVALALLHAGGEALHPKVRLEADPAQARAQPDRDPAASATAKHWQRDGRFLIRYGGPPGHVEQLSYIDVLRGAVPPQRLQGRYVLIGMTAQGLGDTLATPVNAQHRAMPGVEVLAQTLHMLRSGDTLRVPPLEVVVGLSALLVLAGVLAMARLGQRAALLAGLGGALALLLGSVAAVGAGWWLPPVPAALAALLAYPLCSWRRLELAVQGLDTEIRHLGSGGDLAAGMAARRATGSGDTHDAIETRLQRLHSAGELLREARRYLADILESLPTAMLVANDAGRVLLGNAQAAALFEVGSAEELQQLDVLRLLGEFQTDEPQDWAAALVALQPGGGQLAYQVRLAGQGDFVLLLSAAALAGARRVLVSIADVAPVKRAERQREEALAFVTHDLRSPASAILLLTDRALAGSAAAGGTEGLAEWLPQVRQLAKRSLELSEAFVRYAQAELVAPLFTEVDLAALADEAAAAVAPQAAARDVMVATPALSAQPLPANGTWPLDRALVLRALCNLLDNAVRHSPEGCTVGLQMRAEEGRLVLTVSDEGPGLDAAQQRDMQLGDEGLRSSHADGIGLGLRFVQRVARRHGGHLRWQARAGAQPGAFELWLGRPASGHP